MTRVVDYAWARPGIDALRTQGVPGDPVVGVIRYLSLEPSKNLSPAEYRQLKAAGFAVSLVWETAADIALGGHDQGVRDAQRANAQADALGYPRSGAIYYAVDFEAQGTAMGHILDYFKGVREVGVRKSGAYGSYYVVEACVGAVDYLWQTAAWSHGNLSAHAHLYQHFFTQDLDVSAVKNAGWGQDTGKKEDDMPLDANDKAWLHGEIAAQLADLLSKIDDKVWTYPVGKSSLNAVQTLQNTLTHAVNIDNAVSPPPPPPV